MTNRKIKADIKGFWTLEDYNHFYDVIEKKRKEILEDLNLLRDQITESTDEGSFENKTYSLHMADQGSDAMEREKTFMFASREGKVLDYLERAIQRLENGTYGYCKECQEPLEKGRLEAVPHTQICAAMKNGLKCPNFEKMNK